MQAREPVISKKVVDSFSGDIIRISKRGNLVIDKLAQLTRSIDFQAFSGEPCKRAMQRIVESKYLLRENR